MKEVFTIREMHEKGYGRNELYRVAHSEDFWQVGHKDGTVYKFNLEKYKKYKERKTKWQY